MRTNQNVHFYIHEYDWFVVRVISAGHRLLLWLCCWITCLARWFHRGICRINIDYRLGYSRNHEYGTMNSRNESKVTALVIRE
jgi:hypothetical protein